MTTARRGVVVLVLTALGCSMSTSPDAEEERTGAATDPIGVSRSAIQGGALDNTSTFVVGLNNGGSTCTAVMIAPNLALASRHCIDITATHVTCETQFTSTTEDNAIALGNCPDVLPSSDCSAWKQSSKLYRPPSDTFCGNDLVVVQLRDSIPDIVPATPNFGAVAVEEGTEFSVVGYGAISPDAALDTAGIRRRIDHMKLACVGAACSGTTAANGVQMTDNEFTSSDTGVCEGDSGAPAFVQKPDGTVVVLGLVSRVGYQPTECSGSIYTRLDTWRTFIASAGRAAAAAGGYPAPAWSAGLLGDACTAPADCGSQACATFNGASMCTHACSATLPCETGYQCGTQALCEPAPVAPTTPAPAAPTGPVRLGDGCSCGVGPMPSPSMPASSALAWPLALAALALRSRRSRPRR